MRGRMAVMLLCRRLDLEGASLEVRVITHTHSLSLSLTHSPLLSARRGASGVAAVHNASSSDDASITEDDLRALVRQHAQAPAAATTTTTTTTTTSALPPRTPSRINTNLTSDAAAAAAATTTASAAALPSVRTPVGLESPGVNASFESGRRGVDMLADAEDSGDGDEPDYLL